MDWGWIKAKLAAADGHPLMVGEAWLLLGTHEGDGQINSPVIMSWVEELTPLRPSVRQFTNDHKQAWCGLFAAHCAHLAGWTLPPAPLWALDWAMFGMQSPKPSFGDVLVFRRLSPKGVLIGGHVGLYVGESTGRYWVLGGNEGDAVRVSPEPRNHVVTVRRPPYHSLPANVLPVFLQDDGSPTNSDV